jgi:hypothetical protein
VTAHRLRRRVDALEETTTRRLVQTVADEYGLDVVELRTAYERLRVEERRLRSLGLSDEAVRQGLFAWVDADVGVEAITLEAEWQECLRGVQ